MLIPLLTGLVAVLLPSPSPISCECPELPSRENLTERQYDSVLIRQAFSRSDVVFFAQVTGFENKAGSMYQASLVEDSWDVPKEKRHGIRPTLELKKAYKGSKKFYKQSDIRLVQRWRLCDMYFNKFETYVFFGTLDKQGAIRTNICNPNRIIRSERQLQVVESWFE